MNKTPALPTTIADLIEEYDQKHANVKAAIDHFDNQFNMLGMNFTVQGTFIDSIGSNSYLSATAMEKNLLKSGWRAAYNRLSIKNVASAKDIKLFDQAMADPPPFTMENVKATFGDYLINPRFHILKGLAEVFTDLDPAYKSHSKVMIGVKGLPKRIIITGWGGYSYCYGRQQFENLCNALAAYQGIAHFTHEEMSAIDRAHLLNEDAQLDGRAYIVPKRDEHSKDGVYQTVDRGLSVKRFMNGNAHVIFSKQSMLDVNRALAEFYGEVLPDVEEDGIPRRQSTEVAKDLQFYWSPKDVVRAALDYADIYTDQQYSGNKPIYDVLEPSCGDGCILDGLAERGMKSTGIEYDPKRAAQAKAKGHSVMVANFLEHPPQPTFDKVVMNPPFYGRHYMKHVQHALKFLKPGGTLVAILPATARYDYDDLDGSWRDLPVASFAEAGTNVPTVLLRIVKGIST